MPCAIISRRLRLVAAMTRTSTRPTTRSAPTFCSSPVSRNRSSSPCMRSVISPISSRNIVPRVGQLQLAELVAVGAGEAALDVAEELGFEQRFGQAGAVDGHEGPLGAGAPVVHGLRDQLLAGAALAGDQHLGVGSRHALDLGLQFGHRWTSSDEEVRAGPSHRGAFFVDGGGCLVHLCRIRLNARGREKRDPFIGFSAIRRWRLIAASFSIRPLCKESATDNFVMAPGELLDTQGFRPSSPNCGQRPDVDISWRLRITRKGQRGSPASRRHPR